MADTPRTLEQILALLPDQSFGEISPQRHRDQVVSTFALFGSLVLQNNATSVPEVSGWTKFVQFGSAGPLGFGNVIQAQASTDQRLLINLDGAYEVCYTLNVGASANSGEYRFAAVLNGNTALPIPGSISRVSSNRAQQVTATFHVLAAAGNRIELYYDTQSGTGAFTVRDACMTIKKIG